MNSEKELMRFIREAIKSGGGVDISFYAVGDHITASIESAYLKFPKEEEEVDIITLTPAKEEKEVEVMDLKEAVQKYYDTKKDIEESVKEKETLF